MRKSIVVMLAAASLVAVSVPAMAMEHGERAMDRGQMEVQHDEQCQKECNMLVKNCRTQVDSIQQQIRKLQDAVRNHAGDYSDEQLRLLKRKLEDAQGILASLEKGGA